MAPTPVPELRAQGNALYREANFEEAATNYQAAIIIDPSDNAARRNLSSAKFELGKYVDCISIIREALQRETDEGKKAQLKNRMAKCYMFFDRPKEARDALDGLGDAGETGTLLKALEGWQEYTAEDKQSAFKEIVKLPLFRPTMVPGVNEYYPRGHDDAVAAIASDALLARSKKGPLDLSFFYGGVGDARHFLQQLYHIHDYHKKAQRKEGDRFFFTLQDLKSHALAKNLLVFKLLLDVTTADTEKEQALRLATVWYVFAGDIMPPYIYERLREALQSLLKAGSNFDIAWLRCDSETDEHVRAALRDWLKEEFRDKFDVKSAQKTILLDIDDTALKHQLFNKLRLQEEWRQFHGSLLIYPPSSILQEYEPELAGLIESCKSKTTSQKKTAFTEYAQKNWRTNLILLQEAEWFNEYMYKWEEGIDPLATMKQLLVGRPEGEAAFQPPCSIIELCFPMFLACSKVLAKLDIVVEFKVDCVYHQMDSIRLGTDEKRDNSFPKAYDTIFLSNIPDYAGGHLTTMLHALTLLKKDQPGSYVQSNILANPGCFPEGLSRTFAEYLCLPSADSAKKLLGITEINWKNPADDTPGDMMFMFNTTWLTLSSLRRWALVSSPASPQLPYSKPLFSRWLTHMFFKIAMPAMRDMTTLPYRVHQPLTLKAFIELCIFLVNYRGVPKHWIASTLDTLLEGEITTSAEPPEGAPLSHVNVSYLKPDSPARSVAGKGPQKYNLSCFVPELRMLLAKYQATLPFRLMTPLPSKSDMAHFAIEFEITDTEIGLSTQLLDLAFISKYMEREELQWIHASGERLKGRCYIFSGFWWTAVSGLIKGEGTVRGYVRWCMERRIMNEMRARDWKVGLVRTDRWTFVGDEFRLARAVEVRMGEDGV